MNKSIYCRVWSGRDLKSRCSLCITSIVLLSPDQAASGEKMRRLTLKRINDDHDNFLSLRTADVSPRSSPLRNASREGTSTTQRQKFHTDDVNQCLHKKIW